MLSDLQQQVLQFVRSETLAAQKRFHNGEDVVAQIDVAAGYAFALYRDLTKCGVKLEFSSEMRENREVAPTDPGFFRHLHALQDFVRLATDLA